jgi:hypothetical protein
MNNKRKQAIKWWNNLQYSEKWEVIASSKSSNVIFGGVRSPDTLTGSEIEKLYNLKHVETNFK